MRSYSSRFSLFFAIFAELQHHNHMKRLSILASIVILGLAACVPENTPIVAATAISLSTHELTLEKGANEVLTVSFTPENVTNKSLTWVSSNKSISEVTDGIVVGVGVGSTEIIVKHGDLIDKCTVTVVISATINAVDLGLSVKWAECNLGASAPEEYGDYYAWGETETKEVYSWVSYKFRTSGENWDNVKFSKYNTNESYGTVDNKTVLDPEDDVAHVKLGGSWRLPTDQEWTELRTQCTWTWTTENGVNGRRVTGPNGNSIFLPAAGGRGGTGLSGVGSLGSYWSSSLSSGYPIGAWYVYFYSDDVYRGDYGSRYYGLSVRPVLE